MASKYKYEVEVQLVGREGWHVAAAFDTPEEAWAFKYEGSQAEGNLGKASAHRILPPKLITEEPSPMRDVVEVKSGPEVVPIGRKDDQKKPRFDLLPMRALRSVANVLTFGAEKYGVDNWRLVPDRERRYLAATFRHVIAHALGERLDPETGEPHLAHAACCVLFMLDEVVS